MPVNFNTLQPIEAPHAVGQLPVMPNQTGAFAGGIMEGLAQGQQIAASKQAMAAQQQQMNFDKQNNPLVLQQNQQKVESGAIDLQDKKTAQAYANKLREAAGVSKQAYYNSLSPDDQHAFDLKAADINAKVAEAAKGYADADKAKGDARKANAEASTIELGNAGTIIHQTASIMNPVSAIKDPQKQQAAYQMAVKMAPADVQKILPPQYDKDVAAHVMIQDKINHADALQKASDKTKADTKPTPEMQNTQALHDLKGKFDAATPGSPEQIQAANDYNGLAKQLKNDNKGWWAEITGRGFSDTLTPGKAPKVPVVDPSKFVVGQAHKDANGNEAVYLGGNPKDLKSWKPTKVVK